MSRPRTSRRLGGAAAFLVLLAAAAGTWIISADFGRFAHDGLHRRGSFLAAGGLLSGGAFVGAGRGAEVFAHAITADFLVRGGRDVVGAAGLRRAGQAGAEDQVRDLVADAGHHFLEIAVAFLLVHHARVALGEG